MTAAEEALKIVLFSALNGQSPLWADRVQSLEQAAATLVKPCVQFFPMSNRRTLIGGVQRKNAELIFAVKGVAEDAATAYAMQDAISDLLDDSGRQDWNPRLPFNADWDVLTVTQGIAIWLQENFSTSKTFYHAGHQYLVTMERKS